MRVRLALVASIRDDPINLRATTISTAKLKEMELPVK